MRQEVNKAVDELKKEYSENHRGFNIIDILEGYQICSRPEYYTYIQEILGEQRRQPLSNAAMEALAIIAYKQPITKGQIEHIRGVNSDGCVNRLYERGLIEEKGRLDAPGRPMRTVKILLRKTKKTLNNKKRRTAYDSFIYNISRRGCYNVTFAYTGRLYS